jgi:hypothetical protein
MIPRGRGKCQAGNYLIISYNYAISALSFRMYQMQVVFRLVALYASRLSLGMCAGRVLKRRPAPDSGPGRYRPADSLSPFAISQGLPETGDRPLILPTVGSYGHRALSCVDFSQTMKSADRKEDKTMEHSQNAGPDKKRNPSRGAASLLRNFEDAVLERIVRYLDRRIRKSNRSHFCCFLMFLLAGRLCGSA